MIQQVVGYHDSCWWIPSSEHNIRYTTIYIYIHIYYIYIWRCPTMADPSHHGGSPLSRPPSCADPHWDPWDPGQFFEICPRQL